MILNSKQIQTKARKIRARLTETESLIAESMARGQPSEDIAQQYGISRKDFSSACRHGLTNIYFYVLIALEATAELEAIEQRFGLEECAERDTEKSRTIH